MLTPHKKEWLHKSIAIMTPRMTDWREGSEIGGSTFADIVVENQHELHELVIGFANLCSLLLIELESKAGIAPLDVLRKCGENVARG